MSNNIYISVTPKGERIALVQDKRLIEYQFDEFEHNFAVGDIYFGTVRKVVSGSNAAFIDIGHKKDAFLHYHDLSPNIKSLNKFVKDVIAKRPVSPKLKGFKMQPQIEKHGKINDILSRNMPVLAQVVKEPISSKGPRLSCDISIAGRYIVLVPFGNAVNISKKITGKQERQRLHKMVSSIRPHNFGIIVRTVAEKSNIEDIQKDLNQCMDQWVKGIRRLRNAKPRDRVITEIDRAASILRDMLNDNYDSIVVDDRTTYDNIKTLLSTMAPQKEKILKLHNGKHKIFEHYGIEKQLKSLFGRTVTLPSGGYLVIEHTEALHVIDVNSGNKASSEPNQEATAVHVNKEAAVEIARQLRLRDMGGIVVVDFIDMKKAENRRAVHQLLREEMRKDRSKHTILPISRFGLSQITRQRVRPAINLDTKESCPTCGGSGKIQASISVTDQIENHLRYLFLKQNEPKVTLMVHPFVYAYYREGIISRQMKLSMRYKRRISLIKDSTLGLMEYQFLNKNGEEIEIR